MKKLDAEKIIEEISPKATRNSLHTVCVGPLLESFKILCDHINDVLESNLTSEITHDDIKKMYYGGAAGGGKTGMLRDEIESYKLAQLEPMPELKEGDIYVFPGGCEGIAECDGYDTGAIPIKQIWRRDDRIMSAVFIAQHTGRAYRLIWERKE